MIGGRARSRDEVSGRRLLDSESPTCAVSGDGTVIAVNGPWLAFTTANGGDAQACGVGADYLQVCDAAHGERSGGAAEIADGLRAVLAGSLARFEHEYPCDGPNEQRWFSLRVSPQPDGSGAVLSHHDVTALKLAERALAHQPLRDPATGLPNRALFDDRLEQALAEGSRAGRLVGVAVIHVDRLATINASHGRVAADELLAEVAGRLELRLRDGDTLARYEGDEFAAVWRDLRSDDEGARLSERFAEAFEQPFVVAGTEVVVTASIGVSIDQWAQTAEELLVAAGAANYETRHRKAGRPPRPNRHAADVPGLRTEVHLRAAMYRDELVVHYQPVVDLTCGTVVGVEALVRWQHPVDGLLEPDVFIPVAESGGLIVALGARVLEQACAQATRWQEAGLPLNLAVNLSTRQVAHPDLVQTIARVLRETGMDPRRLVLEVTESTVMEDAEAAAHVFSQIVELGVSLTIDDFGTGYSSLVYLKRYPIEALKIDRSFIGGMGVNDDDDAIVASVIGLANAVGGTCIAEGIETQQQYAGLRALRCRYGQGWLFGRAVPADALPSLVEQCTSRLAELQRTVPKEEAGQTRLQRDQAADERELVADERDLAADERDQAADVRDQAADVRDQAGESERIHAELDRENALADRGAEASVRAYAERERRVAAAHRTAPSPRPPQELDEPDPPPREP